VDGNWFEIVIAQIIYQEGPEVWKAHSDCLCCQCTVEWQCLLQIIINNWLVYDEGV